MKYLKGINESKYENSHQEFDDFLKIIKEEGYLMFNKNELSQLVHFSKQYTSTDNIGINYNFIEDFDMDDFHYYEDFFWGEDVDAFIVDNATGKNTKKLNLFIIKSEDEWFWLHVEDGSNGDAWSRSPSSVSDEEVFKCDQLGGLFEKIKELLGDPIGLDMPLKSKTSKRLKKLDNQTKDMNSSQLEIVNKYLDLLNKELNS